MRNLVVLPNVKKDIDFLVTKEVVNKLLTLGFNVYIHEEVGYADEQVRSYGDFPDGIDLIVVIGGDGSVIDAAGIAIERDIPILGVNLGRMGYLTEVEVDEIPSLSNLVTGEYSIIEKMLLSAELSNGSKCDRYAVNDITVSRDSLFNIADIKIEDSINNAVKLRADGVILSTPQGSTAYSFSAGGPILAHDVEGILLTPVSSHSFFNRSVMFNASDIIKVTNVGTSPLNVNVDGRSVSVIEPQDYCRVKRAVKNIKILTFKKNSMFSSLFKKMRILGDID
jgi:NAD+ kinase